MVNETAKSFYVVILVLFSVFLRKDKLKIVNPKLYVDM